jgi:hypothetical protein
METTLADQIQLPIRPVRTPWSIAVRNRHR